MLPRITRLIAPAVFLLIPLAAQSQSDPSFKLSTTNAAAAAHFRAGVSDFQNVSFESAASHMKMAIDADPGFGLARVLYASVAVLTPAQQRVELDRGVADAMRANANEGALAAAYRAAALNQADSAPALFHNASSMMPNDVLLEWQAAGGFGQAVASSRSFAETHPKYPLAYNTVAYQEWLAGNHAAALAAAKRQVELLPNAPNPHDTYAEVLQWNGDFAGATAQYREAAKTPPKFPEAYAGLAEVAALQGNYSEARKDLRDAIDHAWNPAQKLNYMRQIVGTHILDGSTAAMTIEAINAAITEAKAQNNYAATATLLTQLATVQAAGGDAVAAHASLASAAQISGPRPWGARYFGTMTHALLRHWAPVDQELAAIKAMPATDANAMPAPWLAALQGAVLTFEGKPDDALAILNAADTSNVLVANRIAEAHAALGHNAEAAAWNQRVAANYRLNLADFTDVNSRRRAKQELAAR
jgi:tetratricopeptide (TPR) repeat protein